MHSKQFLFSGPSLIILPIANPFIRLRRRFTSLHNPITTTTTTLLRHSSHPPTFDGSSPHNPANLNPYIPITQCISLLQLCASSNLKLMQIHAFSVRHGVLFSDPDLGKHLVFAIVSVSAPMSYAHNVFSRIDSPNIFTWNTMIRGYGESENPRPAIELYRHMRVFSCVKPDTHSYPFLLKAAAKLAVVWEGEMIHSLVLRNGFESLIFVQNGLLHMYGCYGCVESVHKVFVLMSQRDLVAWNTVINGFALNGRLNEALVLFRDMGFEGVEPDGFTMVSLLSVCGELGALALGRRAHVYMLKVGLLSSNLHSNNAILDFYAKCGSIRDAQKMFTEMKERSVVSWTSLIVGLAINGFGKDALELFRKLEREGLVPTEITFVGVLYACSHCGMVKEGFTYFRKMQEKYGIVPRIEHYGCMIDLLGRAGLVKEAYEYILNMPLKPNAVIWRTLLGACTIQGNLALGELARSHLQKLEPGHSGDYVLLSNLYASENRWSDVQEVRKAMLSQGVMKTPGYSLVELRNRVYEFVMGDRSHPFSEETYAKLAEITSLLRLEGYVPHTANVLADIEEEEKENALSYHSEKIAVAFMLVNTGPGIPIRILKNLRICVDCHVAFKLISKIYDREIVVRDCTRFHHFGNGSCSCSDYW
ncbi:pentatricopeptide repeat-containing protein At4g21065 [Cannabis sativa]|uniref:pentatricopeptide repeat-containing protein At4g21065 n=1 Tax=Cannabis sativa TaxID=3483 RepID=UPI0011DF0667|nr:pentatricopeptide repeat-containing protein At4g21065 [Cannabis sativa]XP_030480254.1 pentatricopeptide repeat-containing protein At4g21065 [Cannabis sativa]XP_030480255.1 pentatricopeptide repeat-containing protein At4g21065 [Cannabis sativa]XP_060974993.1 pentatricopeptide repeat-containing protein At4g21065 [Cannabis sativa]